MNAMNIRVYMCAKCGTLRGWNVETEGYEPFGCGVALYDDASKTTVTCDGPLFPAVIV